jgi:MULE transposase domain
VRWRAAGGEESSHHSGTARCWCYHAPPQRVKEEVIPSHPILRTVHTRTSRRGGKQVKCGCQWAVSFNRLEGSDSETDEGRYVVTEKRRLTHTGHTPVAPSSSTTELDSLRNVPTAIKEAVRKMLKSGMHCVESERRFLQEEHEVTITRDVFHNLVKKTKAELGIVDSSKDFRGLLEWLQKEMSSTTAYARSRLDESLHVCSVFYMSADMIYQTRRNGQVLLMDTTFKTNRFGWPLLLICGVDEHFQSTLLAVALVDHQTTESFVWALEQMKAAVGEETWAQVASMFSDGDAAMDAAVSLVLPCARHLRCRFHLESNLRTALHPLLPIIQVEEFITAWKEVIYLAREDDYVAAKEKLERDFPLAMPYLQRYHWVNERSFAECYILDVLTFGLRSTARVESWNALLKGALQVNSSSSLAILFESLQFAASGVDRRRMRRAHDEAARLPPAPPSRTFADEMQPWLTHWAATKTQQQFALQHNYRYEQKTVAGVDSVWYVWDKRSAESRELKREVRAKDALMECTCGFPSSLQLPCRHVLAINLHLFHQAFRPAQVGKRWLKYHMPPSSTPLVQPPSEPLPSTVPNFISSLEQSGTEPRRQARFGQLMGYCMTICTRGADYGAVFNSAYEKVRALAHWIEVETSVIRPVATQPVPSSSSSVPSALSSVPIDDMLLPQHKKKQRGRVGQKRVVGAAEQAAKRGKISASQAM